MPRFNALKGSIQLASKLPGWEDGKKIFQEARRSVDSFLTLNPGHEWTALRS